MRISDWSSDVCSSDLIAAGESILEAPRRFAVAILREIKQVSLGRYRYEAICEHHCGPQVAIFVKRDAIDQTVTQGGGPVRSEENTSELQSLMRISYAVFCLKKKHNTQTIHT